MVAIATKPKSPGVSRRASTRMLTTPSAREIIRHSSIQPAPIAVFRPIDCGCSALMGSDRRSCEVPALRIYT